MLYADIQHLVDQGWKAFDEKNYSCACRLFLLATEYEHPQGWYGLARLYEMGQGIEQSISLAKRLYLWIQIEAKEKDPMAQFTLGLMYHAGHGVKKNVEKAIACYTFAVKEGIQAAYYYLGTIYDQTVDGTKRNETLAIYYYHMAADTGDPRAQKIMGAKYAMGDGVAHDVLKAIEYYKLLAKTGDPDVLYGLGALYEESIIQAIPDAITYYRLAAERGHEEAYYRLGVIYEEGIGVSPDRKQAKDFYYLAAQEHHHIKAQYALGLMCEADQNMHEAINYYTHAADQGLPDAQNKLAVIYEEELHIKGNAEKALVLYQLAARQGIVSAQYRLGLAYEVGTMVLQNRLKAEKWYEMASVQGHADAQFRLGLLYEKNKDFFDTDESVKYYTLAAKQNHPKAKKALKRLHMERKNKLKRLSAMAAVGEEHKSHFLDEQTSDCFSIKTDSSPYRFLKKKCAGTSYIQNDKLIKVNPERKEKQSKNIDQKQELRLEEHGVN